MKQGSDRRDSLIYEKILAHMRDGVVTIDLKGQIIAFNEAAGQILGRAPTEAVGQSFAEIFLSEESFDDFNEVVLKAIYESQTTHSQEVSIHRGGQRIDLFVSSSFLKLDTADEAERYGVIVVFSDVTQQRKRRKIKRLFGEYIDPRIVERILAHTATAEERGRRAVMTVAFTDMRDFTGWSERLEPEALIALLNRFLAAMTQPIGAAGGITDKYIGDAIMACWGPPYTDTASQAADACSAMLEQRRRLPELRRALAESGILQAQALDASAGVATGEVVAGDVGTESSRNYTVIGNTVNIAARLQGLGKVFGQPIVVSEATCRMAGDGLLFRELDTVALRGREAPERAYALLDETATAPDPLWRLCEAYAAGLGAYRCRDWAAAEARFRDCLVLSPGDRAAALMAERCRCFAVTPPSDSWDGVWREALSA